MSRRSFAVAESLPVARVAVIRRPIAPPFARAEEPALEEKEILELEAPTRRSHDLVRELAAASAHMSDPFDDEEKPTLMVGPQENLRLLAAAFTANEREDADTERPHPATDDDLTLPETPAPVTETRIALYAEGFTAAADPPSSRIQEKASAPAQDPQNLVVAGIWAAALSVVGILALVLTA
ncbi:MAG: hypothetical protein JWP97_2196 [Labilithrix sp.]|nr:hypothetical protein [Labilithrix sp.]